MRIAFLGTPQIAADCLSALHRAGHQIVMVYSQPPKPRGRGQTLQPSPVHALAKSLNLPVSTPASMKTPEEAAAFKALKLDAAAVVAYGQILTLKVLQAPKLGCFNLHASLLPRWRGAAPIQRAIMAGDSVTGVEIMRMTEGLDEGPVIASRSMRIDADETAGSLLARASSVGSALLVETLARIERGQAAEKAQSAEGVTYAKKITPREARIDWKGDAVQIDRQIRGLSPFPGAWFEANGARIKALASRAEDAPPSAKKPAPGQVLDKDLLIACGTGAVRIQRAQREGKGAQDAGEFLRGFPLTAGERVN